MNSDSYDTENQQPPELKEVAMAVFAAVVVWTPVVLHMTGLLDDVLRLVFQTLAMGIEQSVEVWAPELTAPESSPPVTPDPEPAPEPSIAGAIVGLLLIAIAIVLAIGLSMGFAITALLYIVLLIFTPLDAAARIRNYWQYHRGGTNAA